MRPFQFHGYPIKGRTRPITFKGIRSSSSDTVNSESGLLPSDCDSCKEEITKVDALLQQGLETGAFKHLAPDCDMLENEATKGVCEKLRTEDSHAVFELIKWSLEPEPFCTAAGACEVEQSADIERKICIKKCF